MSRFDAHTRPAGQALRPCSKFEVNPVQLQSAKCGCATSILLKGSMFFKTGFGMVLFLGLSAAVLRAQNDKPDPNAVPVVDGGIGDCTADFTIVDDGGSPVYDANISVHIAYGTWSLHKLDLQVGSNAAGKARFTGLPNHTKHGLFFNASQGDRSGSVFDDTAKTCKAQFTIQLQKNAQ
jgi:hypothetical protein